MENRDQKTKILNTEWGSGPNFEMLNPLGGEVIVTARNANDETRAFIVQMCDGRFRMSMGCWIIEADSNQNIELDTTPFDMETVVDAAEALMDQQTAIVETQFKDCEQAPFYCLITPEKIHITTKNVEYMNDEMTPWDSEFNRSIKACPTQSEARQFLTENYGNAPEWEFI